MVLPRHARPRYRYHGPPSTPQKGFPSREVKPKMDLSRHGYEDQGGNAKIARRRVPSSFQLSLVDRQYYARAQKG